MAKLTKSAKIVRGRKALTVRVKLQNIKRHLQTDGLNAN